MSVAQVWGAAPGPAGTAASAGSDPHATRRRLRAEKAELVRWRRLLRARLDLAVASFAPPEVLGAMSWDLLPEAQLSLPLPQTLHEVITLDVPGDRVTLMHTLRGLDQELASYGSALDEALECCTDELVAHLADPGRTQPPTPQPAVDVGAPEPDPGSAG